MSRWFSFPAILLSCALNAQENPSPQPSRSETPPPPQPTTATEGKTPADETGDETETPRDDEFRPSQEISEDYPVPLPADI